MNKERWKPVVGWELQYFVSKLGRVYSARRVITSTLGWSRTVGGQLLTPTRNPDGYYVVHLSRPNKVRLVHQLVMEAFTGPCPAGQMVRHSDDNPANNNWDNLLYGTNDENVRDAIRNGRITFGICDRKHLLSGLNMCVFPDGRRTCRACRRAREESRRLGMSWSEDQLKASADRHYARIMEAA